MPQLRYKFVRLNEGGTSVRLNKVPDGLLGDFFHWLRRGGQEFDATLEECQSILDDVKHYAGDGNSVNNRVQMQQAIRALTDRVI